MRLVILTLIALCGAMPALAGAWLREEGKTFTAVSVSIDRALQMTTSTYLEYGLRPNMTIGADISMARTAGGQDGFATLFLRRPLGKNEGKSRWAYEVGVGARWDAAVFVPHVKAGINWGRGITLREKGGWATVDATLRFDLGGGGGHLAKLDGTVGLNFNDALAGMFQVFISHDGEVSASLAPSVIYTPKSGKFKIQFGAETPIGDSGATTLKVGFWREF